MITTKSRFSSIVEQIQAFASSINLVKESKKNSPYFDITVFYVDNSHSDRFDQFRQKSRQIACSHLM